MKSYIGIVTPRKELFDEWVKNVGKKKYGKNIEFVQIRTMDDVIGRIFWIVKQGPLYYEVDSDIYFQATLRVM